MIGELFNVGSFSEVSNVKEASVVDSDLEKNITLVFTYILLTDVFTNWLFCPQIVLNLSN